MSDSRESEGPPDSVFIADWKPGQESEYLLATKRPEYHSGKPPTTEYVRCDLFAQQRQEIEALKRERDEALTKMRESIARNQTLESNAYASRLEAENAALRGGE